MSIIKATCEYKRVKGCLIRADIYMSKKVNSPVIFTSMAEH